MFSRYLYSKVSESDKEFISLVLDDEEVSFLNQFHIDFKRVLDSDQPNCYLVNSFELKKLFNY